MSKQAVLLVNLGSPDSPTETDVRQYLNQFLMDKHVIQLPWPLRRLIVSLFVLPSRPKSSAEAYKSVWTAHGSPLIDLSNQLKNAVQKNLDIPVEMAMRYGQPSIESQLLRLTKDQSVNEIIFIPLYPHYADSTIKTSIVEAQRVIETHQLAVKLTIIPPFFKQPDYIDALVESATPFLSQSYDHLLFSYHGLPESHIKKADQSGQHCLTTPNCCDVEHRCHLTCYRHQVFSTTAAFVKQANLSSEQYSIAFQSRLGRAKWLGPNTEDRLVELAQAGHKNILVICPAFVTDCLETLEEIAIRGEEVFTAAGGEKLTLIPCLNDHAAWVNVLTQWCQNKLNTPQ